ncbi:MAG TPA: peptidylprolyl isomerase [Thermoanaerobaculia bacterium]|nr:peptidylprolyl isomerase [Thermoanaerobaculia bacterium]
MSVRLAAVAIALLAGVFPALARNPLQPPPPPAPANPAAPAAPAFDPKTLPAVVAKVNGKEVTRDDVIKEAQGAYRQLRQMGGAPELSQTFFRTALDQRIAAILLLSEAESRGIAASPEQIDERMTEMRSRSESDEAFTKNLAAAGMTVAQARDQLAQDISRFNYIEKVILPEIKISDETLRKFYDQNLERMRQPERVKVRHILIEVPRDATEEQRTLARRRAEDVLAKAKAGGDFAALAREYSDDERTKQGGDLPWLSREEIKLVSFQQAAFSLDKGAVSDIIESQAGFHIIQGVDRQASRVAEFDEVKDRILTLLQSQEAQERLRQTVDGLMSKASIERFAL